jgi:hypothetical protein
MSLTPFDTPAKSRADFNAALTRNRQRVEQYFPIHPTVISGKVTRDGVTGKLPQRRL